jgi:hypothetical protein
MESEERTTDAPSDAAAQLAALRADRAAMAERVVQPWWYDALLGLIVFGLISSIGVRNDWVKVAVIAACLAGMYALRVIYTRLTGMWVRGDRKGPTRRAIWVWLAFYVVVLGLAAGAEYGLGWHGALVVGGAVLGVGIALISRWWTHIYVAELRGEL